VRHAKLTGPLALMLSCSAWKLWEYVLTGIGCFNLPPTQRMSLVEKLRRGRHRQQAGQG